MLQELGSSNRRDEALACNTRSVTNGCARLYRCEITAGSLPFVDASRLECVTDEHVRLFREHGLLVLRDVLASEELEALRRETLPLVERAVQEQPGDPDYKLKRHELTGAEVPYRIEYVIDKTPACRALLGHPFILRSVEKIQGPSFVPTWDSMVFKLAGAGAAVTWHRDEALDYKPERPIFNVDVYLDESDLTNCLWGLPGSHRWSSEDAQEAIERLGAGGFHTEGAVPLTMSPGDVLFHDILVVHGSAPARSGLRRVVYYEFRPIETELRHGPHVPAYIPLKQRVLAACLRERAAMSYAAGEQPFEYAPPLPEDPPPTYRYPHEAYFRKPLPAR